ncbi:MAG TPA: ester cyclase [Dehalococcoidia bacterium]|nr:ester cyclase [Dehalococcoidia bacterium]
MAKDLKTLALEFYDGINRGDLSVVDTHVAEDFIDHEEFPGIPPDKAGVRQFFEMMRSAFPDFRVNVQDTLAEGDKVVVRITMSGTHRREFMGIPATNKQVNVEGIDIVRVRDEKAVEHWGVLDVAAMMQQLGVAAGP